MTPTRPHVEGNLPSESSHLVSEEAEPPASDFPVAQSREGAPWVGRGHKHPDPRDTSAPAGCGFLKGTVFGGEIIPPHMSPDTHPGMFWKPQEL